VTTVVTGSVNEEDDRRIAFAPLTHEERLPADVDRLRPFGHRMHGS